MLFPSEVVFPKGFIYIPDFLSPAEEQQLLDLISSIELSNMKFHAYEAKRKTASFGFDWNFEHKKLSAGSMIPAGFDWLLQKVARQLSLTKEEFAELLVTEYPVHAVINWHRDAPPFDTVVGISLLSDCVFKLRPYDKSIRNRRSIISIPVHRRSLYVLKDDVRSAWEHSINPVKQQRISVTLRTLVNEDILKKYT